MSETPKEKKTGGARLDRPEKRPLTKKTKEKIIMIVMIVLAVVMVLMAAVAVLYNRWVKKPELPAVNTGVSSSEVVDDPATDSQSPSPEVVQPSEPEYDPVQPKVSGERKSEDFYTILVFGTDESSNLTDTMMVVSYDVTNQKATAMSIPRDTLINARTSGVDTKKLNAVYARNGGGEKGITALMNEVSELVGFPIDYYVMVNWELVGLMVDAIDGVYFDVPNRMKYEDPLQDLYIDLQAGYQLLDGDMAMQLVRWRHNNDGSGIATNGDIGRLDIQHDFLKAVLKQTLQLKNATKISQLAALFGENVVSNLSIENLFWFGSQAIFNGLNVDDVSFVTMPFYYGEYPVKSGSDWKLRSFVYPARKALVELINESLNPFVETVTTRQLDLIYVNADGSLSSTSGVLADSSMATLPEEYLLWLNGGGEPEEDPDGETDPDPEETETPEGGEETTSPEDPDVTQTPEESDPPESEAPEESDPAAPEETDPAAPVETGEITPAPGEGETTPEPDSEEE